MEILQLENEIQKRQSEQEPIDDRIQQIQNQIENVPLEAEIQKLREQIEQESRCNEYMPDESSKEDQSSGPTVKEEPQNLFDRTINWLFD